MDNAEAAALQLAVEDALAVEEMALAADRKVRSKLRSTRLASIYTRILT